MSRYPIIIEKKLFSACVGCEDVSGQVRLGRYALCHACMNAACLYIQFSAFSLTLPRLCRSLCIDAFSRTNSILCLLLPSTLFILVHRLCKFWNKNRKVLKDYAIEIIKIILYFRRFCILIRAFSAIFLNEGLKQRKWSGESEIVKNKCVDAKSCYLTSRGNIHLLLYRTL